MLDFILLQVANLPDVHAATTAAEPATQSLFTIISKIGFLGKLIMSVNLVLSVVAVYIFIQKYRALNRAAQVDENFMNNIRNSVQNGNIDSAKNLCSHTDSPMARMVEKGLARLGKPLRDIDAAIENVGNVELLKLEKNLSILATTASVAPMIGFFGTVTGMIQSFYGMATAATVTPGALANGIYLAFISTAIGLAIGIFAYFAYNFLVTKVDHVLYNMEQVTTEFMDMLQEPNK